MKDGERGEGCLCPNHKAFPKHVCPCEATIRELVEALKLIDSWRPDHIDLTQEEKDSFTGCLECKKWEYHPVQRGICGDHYRMLRQRDHRNDHAENIQHYRLREIAREALAKATKEGRG
jgi:hypothetical protein